MIKKAITLLVTALHSIIVLFSAVSLAKRENAVGL